MPLTAMPSRRAATAWPSSCSRIEPKKPSAAATEHAKAAVRVVEHLLEGPVQVEDEQEEDEEPRRIHTHANAEDGRQPEGAASEQGTSMVA